jgi:hypothetical protein
MVIELWKVKGQWFYLIPPERDPMQQLIPASEITEHKIFCDAFHHGGLPVKVSSAVDSVHCHDSLNNPAPVQEVRREDALRWCGIKPQRWDELRNNDWKDRPATKQPSPQLPGAPGHSLDDTYDRAQAIAQANVSNGIRDSVNPSYLKARLPPDVCYSIDATGKCQKTGETIRIPGDLAQPLDWNKFSQTGVCHPLQPDQIEVVLKSTPTNDKRKRYIRCAMAGNLANVRKGLVALGVKDDTTTTSSAAVIPTASIAQPSAPLHAVNSVELASGKNAVTTRSFPDPRGRGPGCEIAEGALVLVQSVDNQTGKVQLFVLPNGKRASKSCTNFLTVDRSEFRATTGYPSPK